ncbi:uncharacterized protein LOC141817793 [Curcuma longa]|uniref:uncharacterized protein LOC141817793 n=1 Tax=Curcuma longa TaxID=136217 RepID=UPI003D9EEF69
MAIAEGRDINKSQVWDCGSSLYDSFELNSFMLRLDSAIASSRCLSMPHSSSSSSYAAAAASTAPPQSSRRKRFRLAKSVQKLVQSVLRLNRSVFGAPRVRSHDQHAGLYCDGEVLRSGRLEAIPEVCEKELAAAASASPGMDYDADAAVRKASSERFAAGATAAAMS